MPESNETCTAVELTVTTSVRADFSSYGNVVSTASKFLSEFYGRVLDNPEEASRVAITAHELLENLVKYSDGGESVVEVGLRRGRDQPFLCIRTVTHPATASGKVAKFRAPGRDGTENRRSNVG